MTDITPDVIDLTDPDLYAHGDPHAVWRWLRANEPAYFHPQRTGPGFWVITKHADVRTVSRDTKTFISSGGTSTMDLERGDTASLDYQLMRGTLVISDPPRHTRLRALVNKAFTPQAIARLQPFVRGVVGRLLDGAVDAGGCDFAADVAARLPFTVICELLGIPEPDRPGLFAGLQPMMASQLEMTDDRRGGIAAAMGIVEYLQSAVAERGATPREDMISGLVAAEIDGARLTTADVLAMCILLFIAGSETTMNAVSGGLLALIEHPAEWERLRTGAPAGTVVEEILRWTSPTTVSMVRTATRDTTIRGRAIRGGDKVTLWYGSANRDEDAFADPDVFDVGREPNDHVAFGFGAHFCLGAGLARLEIATLFSELAARVRGVALAGPPVRLRSNIFTGLERLPVSFTR